MEFHKVSKTFYFILKICNFDNEYISLNQLSPNSLGNFSEFVLTVCLDEKAVAVPEII